MSQSEAGDRRLIAFFRNDDVNVLDPELISLTELLIGEEVPIISSTQINISGESSYDHYEYQKVGISLKVTPRINRQRFVALDVEQEIKEVSERVSLPVLGVIPHLRRR